MGSGSCQAATDYNCFSQVKPLYAQMLKNGFLTPATHYHPALKFMNLINEPDLKMPHDADSGELDAVHRMCRSIVSAFDAMLDAEKDAGITGPLINVTATFSFAVCRSCEFSNGSPALAQMAQLDDAMRNPKKYGYEPKNDVTAAYGTRWTHSFNTANPAEDVKVQFLDRYEQIFPRTPVYIGEYHRTGADQIQDLGRILEIAEASPNLLGISFFQFQVAYWKTGSEMDFGMFGLGDFKVADMPYFTQDYPVYCLTKVDSEKSGMFLSDAVSHAYGGAGVNAAELCEANPLGVSMDQTGYMQIAQQNNEAQMSLFVQRLINMMGATVDTQNNKNVEALDFFVKSYEGKHTNAFTTMASYLGSRPEWIDFDPAAKCVANRGAHPEEIGAAIGWACEQGVVDCENIPQACKENTYRVGDYVFSRFFNVRGDAQNPLVSCSFNDAAVFAPSATYDHWTGSDICVSQDRRTTSSTSRDSETSGSGDSTSTSDGGSSLSTSRGFLPSSASARQTMGAAAFVILVQIVTNVWLA